MLAQASDPQALVESACDDVFLFMPYAFAHNGHGSQLNSYLLAVMIATFTNRALIILEPPNSFNVFKGNSQFGCPPEAWETKLLRKGGEPQKVGWNVDFPTGLSRLIKHPVWLSRGCSVPCVDSVTYEDWDEARIRNNSTEVPIPHEVQCVNDNGRTSNAIVMGGHALRNYFMSYYKGKMIDRMNPPSLHAAEWALRLGAAPHEARVFGSMSDRREIWDYMSALMTRSGIVRFQPWIARDVERFIQEKIDLPLDVPYDSIHVRRGDKLETDARRHVIKYWQQEGQYNTETGEMPRNYIPFTQYLHLMDDFECNVLGEPRIVYVATDDPHEVMREIEELPKDGLGNTLLPNWFGSSCHKYKFVFNHFSQELGFHIESDGSKGACEDRYDRNIAAMADLMILAKSDVFVGEFNSNWGRLVRTFRLKMNDSTKIKNGQRPVIIRETRIAFGSLSPGPPGW